MTQHFGSPTSNPAEITYETEEPSDSSESEYDLFERLARNLFKVSKSEVKQPSQ